MVMLSPPRPTLTFGDNNAKDRGEDTTGTGAATTAAPRSKAHQHPRRLRQRHFHGLAVTVAVACCLLLVQTISQVSGQLYEGSSCRTRNGTLGICKVHGQCVWAMKGYRERTFTIGDMVRCGFSGRNELICCLDEMPDERTTTESDSFIFHDNDLENTTPSIPLVTPPPVTPVPPIRIGDRRKSQVECDRFVREYSVLTFHILGGEETNVGEFPHMVALGYPVIGEGGDEISWNCGGSLVSENFILTAAHCLTRQQPTVARLGRVALVTANEDPLAQDVPIAEILMHPDYVPSRNYHDIALIRLANNVSMNEQTYPACLRTTVADVPNESLIATGWGDTSIERRERSNTLLKTNVTAMELPLCNASWSEQPMNRRLPNLLNMGQLCAHDPQGKNDACQGDSGGPLQMVQTNNFAIIVGITSFGAGCGTLVPSVYARVAFYIDWLESVIWPN